MLPVLLKAALPSVPVVNQLPGVRKVPGADLGSLSASREVSVERDHVTAYGAVCGFPHKDTAPLPYPHVLAFPLHLELMTSPEFPFPAIGSVHLENTITAHRAIEVGEALEVTVTVRGPRPHPRGALVDFVTEVRGSEHVAWESVSTYLRRGASASGEPGPGLTLPDPLPGGIEWRLPADLGRRYAAVSGDRNPIHLYPWTARALGFPRQIAHGMSTLARCLAALENRLPDAVQVEVAFRKPVLLPGSVRFATAGDRHERTFSLANPADGAAHLVGRARAL
ncbi:MaoC family dehydratase [Nocardioides taihuensis]|uniref:MaoC family dehydratase n=1 Tax=Nocardioides taihuensis TaxID=1835606 RepID=A0ABW0BNH4_9ACTN